jgi:hypothetical protein
LVPTLNSGTQGSDKVEEVDAQLLRRAYWLISSDLSFHDCMRQKEKIPLSLIHYSIRMSYFDTSVWFPELNTNVSSVNCHWAIYQQKFQLNSSMLSLHLAYQNVQSNKVLIHIDSMECRLCAQIHPSYIVCMVKYSQLLLTRFFLLFQGAHRDTDCASRMINRCFLKNLDIIPQSF